MINAAEKFRQKNIKVSLQISNTIGHGEYMRHRDCSGLVYHGSPVQNLVGGKGEICRYAFCYNDDYFREYMYNYVQMFSKFQPYCVWIDDDLRPINHMPVHFGCFCDNCISKFNKLYESNFNRNSLVDEINFGDILWRERYIEFVKSGIKSFATNITNAVMSVSQNSYIGCQYSTTNYSGTGIGYILEALENASGKPPKTRPGGGFYDDHKPYELLDKAMYLAYQNSILPDYNVEKCAEVENTPDVAFGKSIYGTCLESSTYLACGINTLSYATLMTNYEPMSWHKKMLKMFNQHRPYWQNLQQYGKNAKNGGVCIYTSEKEYLKKASTEFDWTPQQWSYGVEMLRIGLPLCYNKNEASSFILSPKEVDFLTDDDIQFLLGKPVITDAVTLQKIIDRGYGDCFSAYVEDFDSYAYCEQFSNPILHTNLCGNVWKASPFASHGDYNKLIIDKTGYTEVISRYVEYKNHNMAIEKGYANAIVKTSENTKWGIIGYGFWDNIISFDKRNQILNTLDYINGNTTPAILKSPEQVAVFPMVDEKGKTTCVSLLNCSISKTDTLNLCIRNPKGNSISLSTPFLQNENVTYVKSENGFEMELPPLDGMHIMTVFIR